MGRATIVSESGDGLYTARPVYDTRNAAIVIAAIDEEIASIEDQVELAGSEIEKIEAAVAEARALCEEKAEAWNGAVTEEMAEDEESVTHPESGGGGGWSTEARLPVGPSPRVAYVQALSEARDPTIWQPSREYAEGDVVIPTTPDGWRYECVTAGTSGETEPAWDPEGATGDNEVTWGAYAESPDIVYDPLATYEPMEARLVNPLGAIRSIELWDDPKRDEYTVAPPARMPDNARLDRAFVEYATATAHLHAQENRLVSAQKYKDMLRYRQEALEKKKTQIQAAVAAGEAIEMWCADYTEELTGEVDTIETIGAPPAMQIAPGGASELTASSKLSNIMAMSPAGCALAWMLLPGWQRWRPTYRVGTIHDIDYEAGTADVTLDAALSVAQRLDINQATELPGLRARYMDCDMLGFCDGDRVVVEFVGQLQAAPVIVGHETEPRPCGRVLPAIEVFDANGDFQGLLVCEGGTFEPPYLFLPLDDYGALDPFTWGQWRAWKNRYPSRPWEGERDERLVVAEEEDGTKHLVIDLPATADLVAMIDTGDPEEWSLYQWSGDTETEDYCCPDNGAGEAVAFKYLRRPSTAAAITTVAETLRIADDALQPTGDAVEWARNRTLTEDVQGTYVSRAEPCAANSSGGCDAAMALLAEQCEGEITEIGWDPPESAPGPGGEVSGTTITTTGHDQAGHDAAVFDEHFATMVDAASGAVFCGLTMQSLTRTKAVTISGPDVDPCGYWDISIEEDETDLTEWREGLLVDGDLVCRNSGGGTYGAYDDRIETPFPRYWDLDGVVFAAASGLRKTSKTTTYFFYDGRTGEMASTDFAFAGLYISGSNEGNLELHAIPGMSDLYGNGCFRLLKVN